MSKGEDTPDTYKDALNKLGLEIGIDAAKQIQEIVHKIFDTPTEKLSDDFLKSISGGSDTYEDSGFGEKIERTSGDSKIARNDSQRGLYITAAMGGAFACSCLGCLIAGVIYQKKAVNADTLAKELEYYEKADKILTVGGCLDGAALGSCLSGLAVYFGNNH